MSDTTVRPTLVLMSGRMAAFTVTFLVPVLLVRIFTPAEFGTYRQIFLIVYTLFSIGQIGMAECLFYFIPSHPQSAGRFAMNSFVVLGLVGLLCMAGLYVGKDRVAPVLSNPDLVKYIPIAGGYLILMLMGCILEIVMIARKHYSWAALSYGISDVVRGALLIVTAYFTRSIEWVLIGGILFCALRVVTLLSYLRFEFRQDFRFDLTALKQQFAYTLPFSLAVFVEIVQANYHNFAVSSYYDIATFAIYSVGCVQIPFVDFIANPASNVMMVRIGETIREGARNRLLPIWHDTNRKLALVFFPMVGLLISNGYRLITFLYTEQYAASVPVFMFWTLAILFAVLQTDGVLRALAETRFLVLMNVARLAAIACLMTWALHTFHLIGAVLVTLIGTLVAKSLGLLRIQRLLQVPMGQLLPWWTLARVALAAMLAALPSALLSSKLTFSSLIVLPISGMVFVMVYGGLLVFFGLLTASEKEAITSFVARYVAIPARKSS